MNKNSDGTTGTQGNSMTKLEHKILHVRARAYDYADYYTLLQQTLKECPHMCFIQTPVKLHNHLNKLESPVFNIVSGDYDVWVELK